MLLYMMAQVNNKDTPEKYNLLGQYFTPRDLATYCVNNTSIEDDVTIIEPSCGEGSFLEAIKCKYKNALVALEVDGSVAARCKDFDVLNLNFYDYNQKFTNEV